MRSWKKRTELCCVSSLNSRLVKAVVACEIKKFCKNFSVLFHMYPRPKQKFKKVSAAKKLYNSSKTVSIEGIAIRKKTSQLVVTFEIKNALKLYIERCG